MRHQGIAASKLARSWAIGASTFFVIATLWGGPVGADPLQVTGVTVDPATVAPNNVTTVPSGAGTCANYNSAVGTGVADTNQAHHAGMCRWAGFEMFVEGVPLKQYERELSAGQKDPPFTVTQTPIRATGLSICKAAGLNLKISARVQTSQLNWTSSRPACTADWNRAQMALSQVWPNSTRLPMLASQALSDAALNFLPLRSVPCGGSIRRPSPHQRLAKKVTLPPRLILELEQSLAKVEHDARDNWTTATAQFDQSGAQSACTLHCSCDNPGWVGMIRMTTKLTSGSTYSQNSTQTYFVGGPSTNLQLSSQIQPLSIIDYPAKLEVARSGQRTDGPPADWAMSGSKDGYCPGPTQPQDQVTCFEEREDRTAHTLSFKEKSNTTSITAGYFNQGSTHDTVTFNEIDPFSKSILFEGTDSITIFASSRDFANPVCDGEIKPPQVDCTMHWEWELFKQ